MKGISKKRMALIIFLIITVVLIAIAVFYQIQESNYQKDADIIRLRHLKYYVGLIEEYKEKTGGYPLQENTIITDYPESFTDEQKNQLKSFPVYVEIANSWQEAEAKSYNDSIPFSHYNGNDQEFFKELERGLNKTINEYYDPQKVSTGRPNFYVYMVNEDGNYYFAVHTHNYHPFAFQLAKNYYKVEATSDSSNNDGQAITANTLLSDQNFNNEINNKLSNEGYFTDLDNSFLNESKMK
ncbi:hypothetical protein CO057_00240 [Candidatus Uhrbacteria bacterium CG_4_9_14_0_2_um_filter_41_50]|uniref:Uncharacterized protein n=1 Tax=Candidatus Uhrbacteria bacterium CG_4_9_14_0_2_um_filter_41_50 TaxID=1975031 RepID=A0A2M8EQG8_9BACT|nr:MAG: hypothetical protein CO086_04220 [Candidatus Uhrbacteria bacterium CG_4_9_14_0_8_um_filter_41_16]PJC24931.1 MAG: hypothetical protein CO057_00240 [Candidatus Uhrbacteria bacterium CG_4_9_14_0_2_um_filter_41_50]